MTKGKEWTSSLRLLDPPSYNGRSVQPNDCDKIHDCDQEHEQELQVSMSCNVPFKSAPTVTKILNIMQQLRHPHRNGSGEKF